MKRWQTDNITRGQDDNYHLRSYGNNGPAIIGLFDNFPVIWWSLARCETRLLLIDSLPNTKYGELWLCWRQYRLLHHWGRNGCHWERVSGERVGWQGGAHCTCTRWEGWSPRSGGRLKVLKLEFVFVLAAEIIQVLDSIDLEHHIFGILDFCRCDPSF